MERIMTKQTVRRGAWGLVGVVVVGALAQRALTQAVKEAPEIERPRAMVFPLAGSAPADMRERAAFSFRAKLDRTALFEVIDGYAMNELVSDLKAPIDLKSSARKLKTLAPDATLLIWGAIDKVGEQHVLRLNMTDLRRGADAPVQTFEETLAGSQDLRFAVEKVLSTLEDVKPFEHMSEEPLTDDERAQRMWADVNNPNLVVNPDFSSPPAGVTSAKLLDLPTTQPTTAPMMLNEHGAFDRETSLTGWHAVLGPRTWGVRYFDALPDTDQVVIYRPPERGDIPPDQFLAMNLSRQTADNNGLVARSTFIPIKPATRYRLSLLYRSEGPTQRVFVKGFTRVPDVTGKMTEREIYRRQVPPSGKTDGEWQEVTVDLNPQHSTFPVQLLRVDLYTYLGTGQIWFDDIILKEVGAQTRMARDEAIDKPVKRPGK